ncbi:MAG: zinc-ribbon domain-containing protein [Pseudomonadota bacterium]
MRLICPNCGAQYDVDGALIPEQGRDVQCSNCGHTWFQQSEQHDLETAAELEDEAALNPPEDPPAPPPDAQRPELDPEVANVLREEAEREAAARQADAAGLESQPDLGLGDAEQAAADRTAAARARMARLRGGEESNPDAEAALAGLAAAGSRKELLPDVDEINSSLRPTEDRVPEPDEEVLLDAEIPVEAEEEPSSWGGRLVFWIVVLIALIAVALYIFAPQIVAALPQAEPFLVPYVNAVNGVRAQIDPILSSLVDQAKSLIEGITGGGDG